MECMKQLISELEWRLYVESELERGGANVG